MFFNLSNLKSNYKLVILFFLICFVCGLHFVSSYLFDSTQLLKEDIFYYWKEGNVLASGFNPYERIIGGDLRVNEKYPTCFPLFYIFAAFLNKIGFNSFESFLKIWRIINLFSHITIILLIYKFFISKRLGIQGIFASIVIGFSNISVYIVKVQHLEFLSVALFLISINYLYKKPNLSGLFMGISILIKHFAIIFLPFLILNLSFSRIHKRKNLSFKFLKSLTIIISLFIIPFLIWSPIGFIQSIGFSITRATTIPYLDDLYKIIYLFTYMGIIFLANKIKILPYQLSFLSIFLFTEFNPTVFRQYYFWVLIMGVLAFYEVNLFFKNNKKIYLEEK